MIGHIFSILNDNKNKSHAMFPNSTFNNCNIKIVNQYFDKLSFAFSTQFLHQRGAKHLYEMSF